MKKIVRKFFTFIFRHIGGLALLRQSFVRPQEYVDGKKTFLVINCSPFKNSVCQKFCDIFIKRCTELGIKTTQINIHDIEIKFSNGTYDEVNLEIQKLTLETDGIFIASPTYWYNVPSKLKAYLECLPNIEDRLYERSRPICVAVHAPEGGELGVLQAILLPMNMMGFWIPNNGYAYYRNTKYDDGWAFDEIKSMPDRMIVDSDT